ncbi:hypothetical protein ACQW02_00930 [Humitalea sp. 24SJ18S-53]|uniref:hypothetical protein n=1 Tax=Humitalea sp. 24SJ18S-53 TaxID=3422307 RepID=UPI003D664AB4
MSSPSLQDAANALAAALSRRIAWKDADPVGSPFDQALQRRVLQSYVDDLAGLSPEDAAGWMLQRMAMLEARLMAVQAGQWHGGEAISPVVAARSAQQGATEAKPAIAPVVAEAIVLPTEAVVPMEEALSTEGFYAKEKSSKGGTFRWIGPLPRASLFIPKLKGPIEVRLHILDTRAPDVLGATRVALDGGEWTVVTVLREESGIVLIAVPPVGHINHAATMRLDIDSIRTDSPKRHGKSDDRELSIAVQKVQLRTLPGQ